MGQQGTVTSVSDPKFADAMSPDEALPTTEEERLHSESEVNAIVQQRLKRERQQRDAETTQRLQALGFSSFDEFEQRQREAQEAAEASRRQQEEEQRRILAESKNYRELAALEEKKRAEAEQALSARLAEEQKRRQELEQAVMAQRAKGSLIEAATRAGAVSPDQVASLLSQSVLADEAGVRVVDASGQIRTNGTGAELTVDDLVTEFLQNNAHFARAALGRGAGGQPPGPSGGPAPLDFDPRKLSDPKWIQQNKELVRQLAKRSMGG